MNGKREYDLRDQERREQVANVRVGALCRVEKFDPAAMRVDVQPLSKALDAGVYRTQPQILSVPVALVRGGGFVRRILFCPFKKILQQHFKSFHRKRTFPK